MGTGTMAAGIAAGFIDAGVPVVVLGRDTAKAQACVDAARQLAAVLSTPPRTDTPARVGVIGDWNDWGDVAWVIETITEVFDLKRELFADLDRRVPPHIPIGSNSSGFPITKLAQGLKTRSRMFNAHYFMPAHLVPLVEVVLGPQTRADTAESLCAFMRGCASVPVLVRKDKPGFLANRLQHALSREAFAMIDEGVATPEDVDAAVRFGFGFRYLAAGPVMQRDHAGLDVHCAAAATMYPSLSNTDQPSRALRERVAAGRVGMKAGAGFYDWTPEARQAERERYDQLLRRGLQLLASELPPIDKSF